MWYSSQRWKAGFAALFLLALSACPHPEGPSQSLFETAQFEEQQHNFTHAEQLYKEILRDYPESSVAPKAKERLEDIASNSMPQ